MATTRLFVTFTTVAHILVMSQRCRSCQNTTGNFQDLLQVRQLLGRFRPNLGLKLSRQPVFTKLGCLDICLRTADCDSFDVKRAKSKNGEATLWICSINRRVNSQDTMPELTGQNKGWIHFSVSSQDLHQVNCFVVYFYY